MRTNDQKSAFAGKEPFINPIAFYFVIQLLPYSVFILFLLFEIQIFQVTIFLLILLGINFWFIKNVNGIQLVGLRWKLSLQNGFDYYSKPNPFVPRALDSNSFWIGFFIFMFLWIIAFILSIFVSDALCLVCIIGFLSEFFNLTMFMKSHRLAKNQAEHAALEILQDENINFEQVHSDDEENRKGNNNVNDKNEGQLDENLSDKNNNNDNNYDFYPNENENNASNNDHEEFNLPTFDMPEDNEFNIKSNELVGEKDD